MKNPSSPRLRQTTQIRPQFPQRLSHMTSVSVTYFPALPVSPRSVCQTRLELTTREGSLRNKRVEILLFKMWWSATQRRRPIRQGVIFALQKHKRTEVFSHFWRNHFGADASWKQRSCIPVQMCNCFCNSTAHNFHRIQGRAGPYNNGKRGYFLRIVSN